LQLSIFFFVNYKIQTQKTGFLNFPRLTFTRKGSFCFIYETVSSLYSAVLDGERRM